MENKLDLDVKGSKPSDTVVRGDLIEHGKAPYKNVDTNTQSYYATLKQLNGKDITLWGKELENAVKGSEKNDYISLQKGAATSVEVPVKKIDESGKETIVKENFLKNDWIKETPNKEEDKKNFEEQQRKRAESTQSSNTSNVNKKKYIHTKSDIEQEELKSPSFELIVPSAAISNRFAVTYNRTNNSYADRRKPDVALVQDKGIDLKAKQVTPESVELIVKLAKEKNWDQIVVSGTKDFKRQLWMEATKEGLKVKGYTPTPEELKAVENHMKVKKTENIVKPDLSKVNDTKKGDSEVKKPVTEKSVKQPVTEKSVKQPVTQNSSNNDKKADIKPIVENSIAYAQKNIKGKENQEKFVAGVEAKLNETVEKTGTPTLKQQEKTKTPTKQKSKEAEVER